MIEKLVLVAALLCLWWYLRTRRRGARRQTLRMAIGRKTSNLLGMLKQHDTSDSAAGAVTEALRVLQEAMPDRIAIMSGRELEEIDRAMDDAIRDLEDLPPSK